MTARLGPGRGATVRVRADLLRPGQVIVATEHAGPVPHRRGQRPRVAHTAYETRSPHAGGGACLDVILADRPGVLYLDPREWVEVDAGSEGR